VHGDYAYVGNGIVGLQVIDISSPTAPTIVGFFNTAGWVGDISVVGTSVFFTEQISMSNPYCDDGVRVVDVTTPSSPTEAAFFETPGWAWGLAFSGSHAYVADSVAGVTILGDCHLLFCDGFESGETSTWSHGWVR